MWPASNWGLGVPDHETPGGYLMVAFLGMAVPVQPPPFVEVPQWAAGRGQPCELIPGPFFGLNEKAPGTARGGGERRQVGRLRSVGAEDEGPAVDSQAHGRRAV